MTFVPLIFLANWIFIFLVIGKRQIIAMRADLAAQGYSRFFIDSDGLAQPLALLIGFLLNVVLLVWLFGSSSSRKLTISLRSALLGMALAGFLGVVTELLLRF
jgi:hypothetical protein